MSLERQTLPIFNAINTSLTSIDIKGQYTTLAAPIKLIGQLKVSELLAECQPMAVQDNFLKPLTAKPLQLGIDEAGRGPLLGSVHVAATILPSGWSDLIDNQPLVNTPLSMLTDSKKLSEKKRDSLYPLVQQYALGYIIAEIPAALIDQLNILQATMLGMRLCTEELLEQVAKVLASQQSDTAHNSPIPQIEVLFDGNRYPELDDLRLSNAGFSQSAIDCQAWVKGDARHTSIAAASILAKVSRDQTMYELDAKHPEYSIAKHKGYPTKAHMQAIDTYGVLAEHRRSFSPVAKKLAESE